MRKPVCLIVLVIASVAVQAQAAIELPKIFTDNMVLQQNLPIAVWGRAAPGESVTVRLGSNSETTKADAGGKWRVALRPMKADGKTLTLTIRGSDTVTLKNVVLGEVWLCAGQSNMNRGVEVKDSHPGIRLFWIEGSTVPQKDDLSWTAGWVESTPEAVATSAPIHSGRFKGKPRKTFTEVGYVFGRKIHEELKVPVGLIKAAFGGSNVGAWTPKPDIEKEHPFGQPVERSYVGHTPGLMYQAMIHGMVPLSIRGVLWYQGENDGRNRNYHHDMKTWIDSWRTLWHRPDMPFYFVQIAPTTYAGGKMQYLWESQVWVIENVPHTGLAVSGDILPEKMVKVDEKTGFPKAGGGNPHPPNKHIVGERLANIALVKTYGRPERVIYGPMYDSHTGDGGKVLVKFKHVGSGLAARNAKPLNWFQVSDGTTQGRHLTYVNALAKIVGKNTIEVASPQVKQPKFVRFAWHCEARANLMNNEGLPAVSFRTDTDSR